MHHNGPRGSSSAADDTTEVGDGNLIIHGDNLHALKALLPRYAGRIKCIYIDPPYNTGNEGWVYNDNTNGPLMKEWLQQNSPVDGEDMERHDKWLCMMWPRLHLLRELLSDDGAIFVSIDDNEQHHLRMIMDEIFGEDNFVAQIIAQINPRGRSLSKDIAKTHEYILLYAKYKEDLSVNKINKSEESLSEYNLEDKNGNYRLLRLRNTGIERFNRETRPNLFFPIYVDPETCGVSLFQNTQFSVEVYPITNDGILGCWTWSKEKIGAESDLIVGKKIRSEEWRIYRKDYLEGDSKMTMPKSILLDKTINNEVGTECLKSLRVQFDYPKSNLLISFLVGLICKSGNQDSIILDSFAGSGTTAHAVLALNKEDGGNRKFIMVECEDYADTITAERVRRVIKGVPEAKDPNLREGLSGSFTYCTLGDPIDIEEMLTGKSLPTYSELAAYLLHTASGISSGQQDLASQNKDGLFYSNDTTDFYLLYEPSLDWLRSNDAIFNESHANRIFDQNQAAGKRAVVFAAGKYMGQRDLTVKNITFCQLPYEMLRTE